jgi:hypothetical protein
MSEQIHALGHHQDFAEVLGHIQQTRQRVFAQVNTALIDLRSKASATRTSGA